MLKHSAARTHETRNRAASGTRTLTTILTAAAVTLGLGVIMTLSSNIWLFGLGLVLITGTLGVTTSIVSEVRAHTRATR